MCLLVVLAQERPELPLVVAANRDELFERPAIPMTVLRERRPRILGGRDTLAGGTWLAVNEAGVVAGLTNCPATKDPERRSRGELPIALARYTSAPAAVDAFASTFRPADYNPAWLLVGDRASAFAIDMTGDDAPTVRELPPGTHVLENRPLGASSPKVNHVLKMVEQLDGFGDGALVSGLQRILSDHEVPPGLAAAEEAGIDKIPPEVKAACVHTERYGTRWSGVVTLPADRHREPTVLFADGPACRGPWQDARLLWAARRTKARGRSLP